MSKNQGKKPQTVNKINNLNVEIDYDKLAEAIVRAQEFVLHNQNNQVKKRTRFRNALLGYVNGAIYHGIAIASVLFIIGIWRSYYLEQKFSLLLSVGISILCAIIGTISFLCGQETLDDDFNTTIPLLDLNVSLFAMVLAMVSLFHAA